MNWEAFHRRGDVLHAVIDEVDRRRDGILPMDVVGVSETFSTELDLLNALSLKWHARLSKAVEQELYSEPLDIEDAVIAAWRQTAEAVPGLRLIMDHYIAEPVDASMASAIQRMQAKERELLALWSGNVRAYQIDEFGAPHGALVEEKARAGFSIPGAGTYVPAPAPSFLERLKAAVA